jgi:hypothetical protein
VSSTSMDHLDELRVATAFVVAAERPCSAALARRRADHDMATRP